MFYQKFIIMINALDSGSYFTVVNIIQFLRLIIAFVGFSVSSFFNEARIDYGLMQYLLSLNRLSQEC